MNDTQLLIIICALSLTSLVSTRLAKTWGGTQLQGALSSINYAWTNQGGFSLSRGGDQGPFVRNGAPSTCHTEAPPDVQQENLASQLLDPELYSRAPIKEATDCQLPAVTDLRTIVEAIESDESEDQSPSSTKLHLLREPGHGLAPSVYMPPHRRTVTLKKTGHLNRSLPVGREYKGGSRAGNDRGRDAKRKDINHYRDFTGSSRAKEISKITERNRNWSQRDEKGKDGKVNLSLDSGTSGGHRDHYVGANARLKLSDFKSSSQGSSKEKSTSPDKHGEFFSELELSRNRFESSISMKKSVKEKRGSSGKEAKNSARRSQSPLDSPLLNSKSIEKKTSNNDNVLSSRSGCNPKFAKMKLMMPAKKTQRQTARADSDQDCSRNGASCCSRVRTATGLQYVLYLETQFSSFRWAGKTELRQHGREVPLPPSTTPQSFRFRLNEEHLEWREVDQLS